MEEQEVKPLHQLRALMNHELQTLLFYEIIPYMVAAAVACIAVVTVTMIAEHDHRSLFSLLGILGVVFHGMAGHFYTTQSLTKFNPYGGFFVVVWTWLLWSATGCVDRGDFNLSSNKIIFHGLAESDIALFFSGLFSEVFLLTSLETSVQTIFPLALATFFSIAPYENTDSELLRIQVFLVFATRYFMVYQVRRSVHGREHTLAIDYTVALSGFWILASRNFILVLLGVAVSFSCQLFSVAFIENTERKKK